MIADSADSDADSADFDADFADFDADSADFPRRIHGSRFLPDRRSLLPRVQIRLLRSASPPTSLFPRKF